MMRYNMLFGNLQLKQIYRRASRRSRSSVVSADHPLRVTALRGHPARCARAPEAALTPTANFYSDKRVERSTARRGGRAPVARAVTGSCASAYLYTCCIVYVFEDTRPAGARRGRRAAGSPALCKYRLTYLLFAERVRLPSGTSHAPAAPPRPARALGAARFLRAPRLFILEKKIVLNRDARRQTRRKSGRGADAGRGRAGCVANPAAECAGAAGPLGGRAGVFVYFLSDNDRGQCRTDDLRSNLREMENNQLAVCASGVTVPTGRQALRGERCALIRAPPALESRL
ncbi:hypothetical protein EVAR_32330_1 [Eumeta japonica]|uniref:Uncharacterized protein n=1 Tax=Eumeta variegata TaxID=151549 RepID=A0A4C1ZC97_EUMVA|nr:hypothetical protein EVAR_32330_1 [Eumeta japonica]